MRRRDVAPGGAGGGLREVWSPLPRAKEVFGLRRGAHSTCRGRFGRRARPETAVETTPGRLRRFGDSSAAAVRAGGRLGLGPRARDERTRDPARREAIIKQSEASGRRDVTRWRPRGKFCRRGAKRRVKTRFFLAIAYTRPYSDFVFGCGKFFLPRNSDADERVAGEVR